MRPENEKTCENTEPAFDTSPLIEAVELELDKLYNSIAPTGDSEYFKLLAAGKREGVRIAKTAVSDTIRGYFKW